MPERLETGPDASAVAVAEGAAGVTPPSPREKVDYACPGCHRSLRVRREFFGSTIVCKHCGHQFVPRAAKPDQPAPAPAPAPAALEIAREPVSPLATPIAPELAPLAAEVPPAENHHEDDRDALIRSLGGQVEATQARLDALDSASEGRDGKLMEAIGDLGRLTSDLMTVRLALAALGEDVIAVRSSDSTSGVIESARRVVLDEVASLFQEERQLHQERLQPLQATLDRLHQHHQEFADGHAAALARSEALGERLGALEASPRVDPDHAARLDRLDAAWEDLAAGANALREQSDRLHDQVRQRDRDEARTRAESEAESPHLAEIRAAFDALRTEQEAFRSGLIDHEARRTELEATIVRLEEAHSEHQQAGAIRWQDFEASALDRYRAFEAEVTGRWQETATADSERRRSTLR